MVIPRRTHFHHKVVYDGICVVHWYGVNIGPESVHRVHLYETPDGQHRFRSIGNKPSPAKTITGVLPKYYGKTLEAEPVLHEDIPPT